jgi:hypothetical protein
MATLFETNEITAIYENVLFRAPDPDGLADWSSQLDSGALTLTQIIGDFVDSPEALDLVDPIVRLYNGLFDRAPDNAGLQGWVGEADAGVSFGQIVRDFIGSQEFANDYNGGVLAPITSANAASFITELYHNVLGRTPDTAGFNHWFGVLGTTPTLASEATVVGGFINSAEFISDDQNNVMSWETSNANAALAGLTSGDGSVEFTLVPIIVLSDPIVTILPGSYDLSEWVYALTFGPVTILNPAFNATSAGPDGMGNGGNVGGAAFNDTGFAIDTLNVSAGTNPNTYENLASDAVLVVGATLDPFTATGTPVTSGNVTVTQLGADPTLTVIAAEDVHLSTLNVDGFSPDPLLALYVPAIAPTGSIAIDSVIDPGSTIAIIGGNREVDLGGITDGALTLIDASQFAGALVLGSAAAPLSQTDLKIIDAPSGTGAALFTSGTDDTITVTNATGHGPVIVQATGAGDNISVDLGDTSNAVDSGALVGASGLGDTLTLVGGGIAQPAWQAVASIVQGSQVAADVVAAAGDSQSAFDLAFDTLNSAGPSVPAAADSSLGANDVINIGDPAGVTPTTAIAWLGTNSTVNITEGPSGGSSTTTTADIWVTGDVTGATSSGAYAYETINWPAGTLNLYFFNEPNEGWAGGSAANSAVDVSAATSLANALDIAASGAAVLNASFASSASVVALSNLTDSPGTIGLVDWFQYGGNTYVTQVNSQFELQGNTGLVDWFIYGGNTYVVETNNGTAAAASHPALGAGDVVIELVGVHNLDGVANWHFA